MNADERRFVASAFLIILEADLAEDAVRAQADAGLSEHYGWRARGGAGIGADSIIDDKDCRVDF